LQDLLELSFQIVQNHSTIKKSNIDLLIVLQVKKKKKPLIHFHGRAQAPRLKKLETEGKGVTVLN
jgi:hypothetical protein